MKLRNANHLFPHMPTKPLSGFSPGGAQRARSSGGGGDPRPSGRRLFPAVIVLTVAGTALAGCNPFSSNTPATPPAAGQDATKKGEKPAVQQLLDRLEGQMKSAEAALEQAQTENRTAFEAAKKEADGVIAAAQAELTKAREEQGTLRKDIAAARTDLDAKTGAVREQREAVKQAETRQAALTGIQAEIAKDAEAFTGLATGMDEKVDGVKEKATKAAEHAKALWEKWEATKPSPEERARVDKALGKNQLELGKGLAAKVNEGVQEAERHAEATLKATDPLAAQKGADLTHETAHRAEARLKQLQDLAGGEFDATGRIDAVVGSAEETVTTAKEELEKQEEARTTAEEHLGELQKKAGGVDAKVTAAEQGLTTAQDNAKGILQKAEEANSQRLVRAKEKVDQARQLYNDAVGKVITGGASDQKK